MNVEIIVAVDKKGGFGKDGHIPWNYPKDLKRFKELTTGGICIMGRKTYEEMLEMRRKRDKKAGKKNEIKAILPNRQSFVITSDPTLKTPGAHRASSIIDAINSIPYPDTRTVYVIGGERLYSEALLISSKIHMTWVPGEYSCDKFFPITLFAGNSPFKLINQEEDGKLIFTTYERRAANVRGKEN